MSHIAADLTLRERVRVLEERVRVLEERAADYPDQPDECRRRTCDYYGHYLAHGPKELEHEGYHAAVARAERHMAACSAWESGRRCSLCCSLERLVRS